jgi:hypothetical protein
MGMEKPSKANRSEHREPSASDLIRIIERLVDGIDGYECESGDLRYWNRDAVEAARRILGSPEAVR